MFPNQEGDRLDSIATLINNHSIMVKSKETKPLESLLKEMKITVEEEATINYNRMDIENIQVRPEKKKDLARRAQETEEKFRSKIDKSKQLELENIWKDFVGERNKKRERRADGSDYQDPISLLDTENPECIQIREHIFKQMQKYEDKEGKLNINSHGKRV